MDEKKWIKKIQRKGDRSAADKLIRKYYDEIYLYVKKQLFDEDMVLDLTQEIFISMLKTIRYYDINRGTQFRTWLYRIATNKLIDWFRSRSYEESRITLPLGETEIPDNQDLIADLEQLQFTQSIHAFLDTLPPDTQKIFRLRIFGEYTFPEIATMMNLPEGTVKSKYYRLIDVLRKEFGHD